jgi:hypothetical protein
MKKRVFWELVLILASVPVFRSLWIMLDNMAWLQEPLGVSVSLMAGLALGAWALFNLHSK